jgi:bifunctional ADP-heptose synthase (sugar kinase/adenylyltransferase)
MALLMDAPTITKTRFLDSQYKQQLLRVDYEKKERITKDNIDKLINILKAQKPAYILISDYNK